MTEARRKNTKHASKNELPQTNQEKYGAGTVLGAKKIARKRQSASGATDRRRGDEMQT